MLFQNDFNRHADSDGGRGGPSPLLADVGHEGQLPGALDGRLQRPLMCGADTRDPPRLDLAALRNERRQQLHVLVIDVINLLDAELADPTAPEEPAASPGLVARGATVPATGSPAAAASSNPCPSRSSLASPFAERPFHHALAVVVIVLAALALGFGRLGRQAATAPAAPLLRTCGAPATVRPPPAPRPRARRGAE